MIEATADSLESNSCPSAEDLCAWFDGELVDDTIQKHVDSCPGCKSVVKSYKRIDTTIKENLERPTQRDMGILVRIKDSSMKEINRTRVPLFGTAAKIKALAFVLAIICLLGVIYITKNRPQTTTPTALPPEAVQVDPLIVHSGQVDKQIIDMFNTHKSQLTGLQLFAVGTNPERLETVGATDEDTQATAQITKTFSATEPSHPLKLLKPFLETAAREQLDEAIFETADYATVIVGVESEDQGKLLDELFGKLGCTFKSKADISPVSGKHNVRYSFILAEKK